MYANYPNSIKVFTFETTKLVSLDNLQLRINKSTGMLSYFKQLRMTYLHHMMMTT
jgi:hypothetical protein